MQYLMDWTWGGELKASAANKFQILDVQDISEKTNREVLCLSWSGTPCELFDLFYLSMKSC